MSYIEVSNVSKKYKDKMLVEDVSFTVEEGEILGIVGLNGSGKTVLLKCICGLMDYSAGSIKVDGKIIGKDCELREGGRLCDISPTIIKLLGLTKPEEMTGESLIK